MGLYIHLLREARGSILGWAIGMAALVLLIVASYPAVRDGPDLDEFWAQYQDSLGELLGDCPTLTSYACYMDTQLVAYLPVLLGIFGVMHASRLAAGAEEAGRLDLLLATPISRRRLAVHHLFVIATAQAIVAGALGVVLAVGALLLGEPSHFWGSLIVGLNALPAALVFATLTYFVSTLVHRRGPAVLVGTSVLMASYFVGGLAPLSETLEPLKWLSATHYYQQSQPLREGLDLAYFILMLPLAALFGALGVLRFDRKDITG